MAFTVPTLLGVDNAGNSSEFDAWTNVLALLNAANYGQLQGFKNRLMNGSFSLNQRGVASNADDSYCFDRWYILTQTGAVACSALTDPEAGTPAGIRITQSQASAQRMGIAQIIESQFCRDLRSTVATLAGRVRLSTGDDVRYAVLEWTGTADSVTSDVVSNWTSTTYDTTGFFISSNVNVLACGEVAATAATWRDLDGLNASVGASMNNLIVMVWTENAVAQNVTLDLNRMQLEPGQVATRFDRRPQQLELMMAQRYYEKSFPLATAPAQNAGLTGAWIMQVFATGAFINRFYGIPFMQTKRIAPTVITYNPMAANAQVYNESNATSFTSTATVSIGERSFRITATGDATNNAGQSCAVHWTAEAEL